MTHAHLYHEPLPSEALLFDGTTYDLGWDGSRTTPNPDVPILPTYDHALYLINAVKFRCGQMYHLFDDDDFMACLHRFYSEPRGTAAVSLWYIHFHLILAFGKGFVQQKSQGKRPPGSEFFSKALRLLPDPCSLWYNPIESTEILCCISLYYQSLDCRQAAHSYVCPSTLAYRPVKLIQVPDRPGHAVGHGTGHAYPHAGRIPRREYGPKVPQNLVDDLHSGPRDDFPDGPAAVYQR